MHLLGSPARSARTAPAYGRSRFKECFEDAAVVHVGGGEQGCQWNAVPIYPYMSLCARLTSVTRTRTGAIPTLPRRDAGGIHRRSALVDLSGIVQMIQYLAAELLPHPSRLPIAEPAPAGRPGAEAQFLRQAFPTGCWSSRRR